MGSTVWSEKPRNIDQQTQKQLATFFLNLLTTQSPFCHSLKFSPEAPILNQVY